MCLSAKDFNLVETHLHSHSSELNYHLWDILSGRSRSNNFFSIPHDRYSKRKPKIFIPYHPAFEYNRFAIVTEIYFSHVGKKIAVQVLAEIYEIQSRSRSY